MTIAEYDKISDQLCGMNYTEGDIASYLHDIFYKEFSQEQPQI